MRLKKYFMLSNAAIVVIPLIITVVASFAFIFVSSWIFDAGMSYKDLEKLAETKYELFDAHGSLLQVKPELLLDKDFQQHLAARFAGLNTDIVVLKKREAVFATQKLSPIDIEKCLQNKQNGLANPTLKVGGTSYSVRISTFTFADGDSGSILLLSPIENREGEAKKLLYFTLGVFFLSFLVTSSISSVIFTHNILEPLSTLQVAAGNISQGSLNYEVVEQGSYEVRELCRSFEQMRLKLKDSIHLQMKYDDNRKMLVSSISHDLKTPITSIKGYVEGILDGVANSPEKVEKYLKTVYTKAVQVDSMIDDLLLYSKLDLNQIPFHFEKTDIVYYFEDCIAENESELEQAGIHIQLQNELKDSRYVMMDKERVRRVVMNILDNARKYMNKPQGEIIILLRESSSSIIIQIQDNGAGIPKEDLPFIFNRFYRADASRSQTSGSGLGLAIASQIIEGHGGKIWVKSRIDEGTSIMISLKKTP